MLDLTDTVCGRRNADEDDAAQHERDSGERSSSPVCHRGSRSTLHPRLLGSVQDRGWPDLLCSW